MPLKIGIKPGLRAALIIFLLAGGAFLLRMATPDDLRNRDQVKVCAYILDAAYNGNWICQVDNIGGVESKPPLYNWLGALVVLMLGAGRFSYALPALLGTVIAAWGIWRWTLDLASDEHSAWLAVLCYLATNAAIKQTALVRTDGLFTGFVVLCAWQAWRAWEKGRGWWWAWLWAALGTLTKGPFAILLGFAGLSAVFWNRSSAAARGLPRTWWHGVILPLVLAGGWAAMAWWDMGPAFHERVFMRELWGNAVGHSMDMHRLLSSVKPPLYLLSRALPWTPLFLWELYRIFRHPATQPSERRGERYIAAQIGIGLLALMLASHKRGDLVFPLLPAVAILEGRLLGRWSQSWRFRRWSALAAFTLLFLLYESWYLAVPRAGNPMVARGLANREFAQRLEADCGPFFPLSFIFSDDLQYRLGVNRLCLNPGEAAKLLAGPEAVFVATENLSTLLSALPAELNYHVLAGDESRCRGVVGNRSEFAEEPAMAISGGTWTLRTQNAAIKRMRGTTAWIRPIGHGRMILRNTGTRPCTLHLVLPDARRLKIHADPGATSILILP